MISRVLDAVSTALVWWLEGLSLGLPARLRRMLFRRRDRVVISCLPEGTSVEVIRADDGAPGETVLCDIDISNLRDALHLPAHADVVVVLPRGKAISTRLRMPVAAHSALRSVLTHELDRLTPFSLDEIVFDFHVSERDDNFLTVDVALARRADVDDALATAERLGLRATSITMAGAAGEPMNVNLIPGRPRRLPFAPPPLRPSFAAIALGAVIVALYASLARYERLLDEYTTLAQAARAEAVAAQTLVDETEASLEGVGYLARRNAQYVAPIDLLLELTERLPEHTWLTRLSVSANEVVLQGESASASEILSIIEGMTRLEGARFQAPVARNSDSGREQFSVVARTSIAGATEAIP